MNKEKGEVLKQWHTNTRDGDWDLRGSFSKAPASEMWSALGSHAPLQGGERETPVHTLPEGQLLLPGQLFTKYQWEREREREKERERIRQKNGAQQCERVSERERGREREGGSECVGVRE